MIKVKSLNKEVLEVEDPIELPMIFLMERSVNKTPESVIPTIDLSIESYVRVSSLPQNLQNEIREYLKMENK